MKTDLATNMDILKNKRGKSLYSDKMKPQRHLIFVYQYITRKDLIALYK